MYLLVKFSQGRFGNLLTANARLPQFADMMILRLELTAAREAARLATTVREALKEFGIKKVYMWSESCTVLHWLERKGQY